MVQQKNNYFAYFQQISYELAYEKKFKNFLDISILLLLSF